ncbi:MAG: sensor histidine kinase [Planctomycetota bacterium]|jgi:signal transduction histidine kinase
MNKNQKLNPGSGQLRWVILLLVAVVIVPTVGLLWFMVQAVRNVELAAQQERINFFEGQLKKATQETAENWAEQIELIGELTTGKRDVEILDELIGVGYDGAIFYNESGERTYPVLSSDIQKSEMNEGLREAWRAEFAEKDHQTAANLYRQASQSLDSYSRLTALVGQSRCLNKLGNTEGAISVCKEIAFSSETDTADSLTLTVIANGRLFLVELLNAVEGQESLKREAFLSLVEIVSKPNREGAILPSDQKAFIGTRSLELLRESDGFGNLDDFDEVGFTRLVSGEELSSQVAVQLPETRAFLDLPVNTIRRITSMEQAVYSMLLPLDDKTLLLLFREDIGNRFEIFKSTFNESDVVYRILDGSSRIVIGPEEAESEPFITEFIGGPFIGWKGQLYFTSDDVFAKAAQRRITIYLWAGVLVIILMLAAGGFAGRWISNQIKLNKLKNDFIATVSHELKTPLASIRVLVDTLLEGNVKDQEQVTDYLQLTSKENTRLSRLIDNFLTFSRMERNKHAFDIGPNSPSVIAQDAVDAVKQQHTSEKCDFVMTVEDNVPDVLADHDAMVMVLVNLLDNACKYSSDEKRINLRIFADQEHVCFSVKDNGIGIPRRALKKIFSRFYQVDRSLTRTAEGCGLGLSIVKFVVEAHKGKIDVESSPGKGSTFTVRVPNVK